MSGHVPHEFTSISVSAYEAASLSALLQERSADGWTAVSIVPAGTSVVAYLSRPVGGSATATPSTATASTATAVTPEPATPTPASSTGAGWALQPDSASSATTSSSSATTATPAASTTASSSAAAPAGWYADPSGRFELRYWDGGRWTEHVSRGGTQYTDPPVA